MLGNNRATYRRLRPHLGALLILLGGALFSAHAETTKEPLVPAPHYSRIARTLSWMLPKAHLMQYPLNEEISARTWTNYLAIIDYDRSYFLQSDIDEFEPMRLKMDEVARGGDITFAYDVFERFKQRLAERVETVEKLLEKGFDFSTDEEYQWKRKEAAWSSGIDEQNDLWRRRIKNEYLGYQISRDYAESNRLAKAATEPNPPATETDAVSAGTAAATNAPPPLTAAEFMRKRYQQYRIVIEDCDSDWVMERFFGALASAFDPHTSYMAPTSVEDFTIDMNLSLSGIGALLSAEDGMAKVNEIIPGGPASRDERDIRLQPGDKIIGVGQGDGTIENIMHLPLNKIVRKIRGEKGTRVNLQVISVSDPSGNSIREVDLVRDDVKLEEQAATGHVARVIWEDKERAFGVVRLPTFYGSMTSNPRDPGYRSCTDDIAKIITGMKDEVEGLILDLRGNGGGSLREAIDLTGRFIRTGPVVQQREGNKIVVHTDRDPAITFRKPLIVLVNRISASASEIVAAALQDYGRALIVGDSRTHGKGSVQTIIPLSSTDKTLGSLKVTIANYYRINGGSTQLRGVEPDVVIPSPLEHLELGEDKLPNAMPWSQIAPVRYSQVYDLQPLIPVLNSNLQERVEHNERYQRHLRTIEHIREASKKTSVPLEYGKRYQQFITDRQLGQDDPDDEGYDSEQIGLPRPTKKDRKKDKDVVLDTALEILADLCDLQKGIGIDPALDHNEVDIQDWFRRIFSP